MNIYGRVEVQPHAINLAPDTVSGQLHALAALLPEKEPLVPTRLEGGWVPELVWMQWKKEKNLNAHTRTQTLAVQTIA
jgi:hypothetical protein